MSLSKHEKRLAFLAELSELSNKYGFFIEGCGCCSSPSLNDEVTAHWVQGEWVPVVATKGRYKLPEIAKEQEDHCYVGPIEWVCNE